MQSEARKEHRWLQQLVGEWTFEVEVSAGPGKPPEKVSGVESVRSLGDLWVLAEGRIEGPDGHSTTVMTLGYDPRQGRYVGTFVGSTMSHLWVYGGELDPGERVLTLETEGPTMTAEGTLAKYRDVIEVKGDDHRVLTSSVLGDDGVWHPFMTASYRRKA
ncbi:MAG TPA: DUF1579 domain-containing protein [Chloroflexota bacterium]